MGPYPTENGGRGWADYGFRRGEAKIAAIQSREDFTPVCKELLMRVATAIQVVGDLRDTPLLKEITQDTAH